MKANEFINEAAIGTEPKRPAREGSRPARGHNAEARYKELDDKFNTPEQLKRDADYRAYRKGIKASRKQPPTPLPEDADELAKLKKKYQSYSNSDLAPAQKEEVLRRIRKEIQAMTDKQGVAEGSDIKVPTEDGIGWQDIRLMAGEGKLTQKTIQQAINVIRKQRKEKQGVAEDADQAKKVFKDKAGKPVGEIGIDPESSPGNGEWYVYHYATGYSVVGFDSAAEAKRELLYVHKHPDAVEGHESTLDESIAQMEAELAEHGKASRELCKSSKPDADLGASMLSSCKSQGLRARDGDKSHKLGKTAKSRVKVGGHRIKGRKYGGPLPDWS